MDTKNTGYAISPYGSFITRIGLSLIGVPHPGLMSSDRSFLKISLRTHQYQGFGCGFITSGGGSITGRGLGLGVTLGLGPVGLALIGGRHDGGGRKMGGLENKIPCNPSGSIMFTGLFWT